MLSPLLPLHAVPPLVVVAAGCVAALCGGVQRIPSGARHPVCLRRAGGLHVLFGLIALALTCASWPTAVALGFSPETGVPGWSETVMSLESALFAWLAGFSAARVKLRECAEIGAG